MKLCTEPTPSDFSLRCSAERSMPMKAAVRLKFAAEAVDLRHQVIALENLARLAQRQRDHQVAGLAAAQPGLEPGRWAADRR